MYVAFNPFYPPLLGQVEKRNASPDRSHNETWDSLVITGFLGFIAYLLVFLSIFYYGLKWLGLIHGKNQRIFFYLCVFGGGIAGQSSYFVGRNGIFSGGPSIGIMSA
jgi:O-antigen ligase